MEWVIITFVIIGVIVVANAAITYYCIRGLYYSRKQDQVLKRLGLLERLELERIRQAREENGLK